MDSSLSTSETPAEIERGKNQEDPEESCCPENPPNCSDVSLVNGDSEGHHHGDGGEKENENPDNPEDGIHYVSYESEYQMPSIMKLIQKDLSEPYSIYTYRYFIHNWPKLCFFGHG